MLFLGILIMWIAVSFVFAHLIITSPDEDKLGIGNWIFVILLAPVLFPISLVLIWRDRKKGS